MRILSLLMIFLTGCASLQHDPVITELRQNALERIQKFDKLRSVHMVAAEIVWSDPGEDAYADWHPGIITIDRASCLADFNDCLNDTIPHELAHEAVYQFSTPIMESRFSHGTMHFQKVYPAHDGIWCDTMKAFGGNPVKHGYCIH